MLLGEHHCTPSRHASIQKELVRQHESVVEDQKKESDNLKNQNAWRTQMKNFNEDKDRNEKELKEALLKFQEKNIEQVREIEDFKKAKQMFENEIKQLKEEKKTFELEREAEKKKHMDSYDRMNEEWQTKTTGLEEKQRKKLEEITSEYQSVLEEQKEENEDIKKERDELKKNKVRLEAAKKKMEEEKRILEVTEMDQENEKQQLEMGRDAEKRKKKDLLDDHSKKLDDLVREHQSVLEDQEKKKEEKEEVGDGIGEVVCRACRIRCATSPIPIPPISQDLKKKKTRKRNIPIVTANDANEI
ncbi:hypothetical protein L3Y34_010565 [Caenorhabditis briggsae]|uniref:Uncharacterized protein n=1 Tax=Caenorhabditis briggsae TaxID=6238 RepID=A0AAE8ZTZ6_CAEBR|nr:hypothetical protein L3Y34_010565 [Caenorhabditis briggsae]